MSIDIEKGFSKTFNLVIDTAGEWEEFVGIEGVKTGAYQLINPGIIEYAVGDIEDNISDTFVGPRIVYNGTSKSNEQLLRQITVTQTNKLYFKTTNLVKIMYIQEI